MFFAFLQKSVDLYRRSNIYKVSINGCLKQNILYLVLFLYRKIMMTHTAYFFFQLTLKIVSIISPPLISLFFYSICTPHLISLLFFSKEKTIVTIKMNFQKIKPELGDLLGDKNPTRGNLTLNPASNNYIN